MDISKVKVADFSRYIAGPACSSLLADLGADVVRIEATKGNPDRWLRPVLTAQEPGQDGNGATYLQLAHNKRSLAYSLKSEAGLAITRSLIEWADVIVANMPEAGLKALGLDWERVHELNPRAILAANTAFGLKGPMAKEFGFDAVAQAMSGAMHLTGAPEEPMKAFVPYCDYFSASTSAVGVMAALMHRELHGQGQRVNTNLLKTGLFMNSSMLTEQQNLKTNRVASHNRAQATAPSDCVQTKDGHIMVMTVGKPQFDRFCDIVGKPEWKDNPKYATEQLRGDYSQEISAELQAFCIEKTTEQVKSAFEAGNLPCGVVLSQQEALDDEHIQQSGMLIEERMTNSPETYTIVSSPVELSKDKTVNRRPAPQLGEHSSEVLAELGFQADDIKQWVDQKFVVQHRS